MGYRSRACRVIHLPNTWRFRISCDFGPEAGIYASRAQVSAATAFGYTIHALVDIHSTVTIFGPNHMEGKMRASRRKRQRVDTALGRCQLYCPCVGSSVDATQKTKLYSGQHCATPEESTTRCVRHTTLSRRPPQTLSVRTCEQERAPTRRARCVAKRPHIQR